MRLKSLSLINFRNYTRSLFPLESDHVLLLGRNGTGKTNFLEAIHYLSMSRSFRTAQDENVVSVGAGFFSVEGKTESNGITHDVNVSYSRAEGKKLTMDGHRIRAKELIAQMSTVVFHNDDMEMVRGPSALRRRYLDMVLAQTDPEYYHALAVYNNLVRQKKELLKKKRRL